MTANRRIILNVVATYGRSLYALVIGLFCGRWALMALGDVDYGLVGLIGGLVCCVSFVNTLLASAVGRFYAISVGAAKKSGNELIGLNECRKWFNTALSIHSVLPFALVAVGYPIGVWAIQGFLTIPTDRLVEAVWVWRFTCLSCFVCMFNVPFRAMYTAKQEIAELTIYSFATTTFNAIFLYYMISHPGIWIVKYSAWTCGLSVLPQLFIAVRAMIKYPECRLRRQYLWNTDRFRELMRFAYANAVAESTSLAAYQARAILVNKYLGPQYNASMSIGNTVASHAMTLSGAVSGAVWPAIANKVGEGDDAKVRKMCFMYCRIGAILLLIFAIPLSLEAQEVLRLWLIKPPDYSAEICVTILWSEVMNKLTEGHGMALCGYAGGYVSYCHKMCFCGLVMVGVAWPMFVMGYGMLSICAGILCSALVKMYVRLSCARKSLSYPVRYWMLRVFIPIGFASGVALLASNTLGLFMKSSLERVVMTSLVGESVFLPLVWFVVFDSSERNFMANGIRRKILNAIRSINGRYFS